MPTEQEQKNLLVNWLNKNRANIQTNLNNNSSTNVTNSSLTQVNPQTDLKAWTKSKLQEKNITPTQTAPISIKSNTSQPKPNQNWVDPTGNVSLQRFNNMINNTNAGTNNFVPATSPQSRFIGFQNLPQTTTQQPATNPLYIETEETKARFQNLKENIKHRDNAQMLRDFSWDVRNSNGKLTADDIKEYYKEWEGKENEALELQAAILPVVQDGQYPDMKWIEQNYPNLISSKNLKSVKKVKQESEERNRVYQELNTTVNKVLKSDWKNLSSDGMRYLEDARLLRDVVEEAKKRGVEGGANDYEIMKYFVEQSPELQAVVREMKSLKLTKSDRANLGLKDSTILARASNTVKDYIRDELWLNEGVEASQEDVQRGIIATEKLESQFGGQILAKVSTEIGVPLDSLEKSIYRTYKDVQNWGAERAVDFVKSDAGRRTLEKVAGRKFTEEEYADIIKKTESIKEEEVNARKQNVLNYQDIVNKEYEKRKNQNLDPDVERFVNEGGSMSNMLLNGQFKSFAYKSAGEAAQNADNLILMLGGTVAPEVVLPAMFADSYARESQESFEELMDVQKGMGIPDNEAYDNAQKGSAIVGLASSLVEVGLEKVIGGVETTASKAFHDLLMKDFTERATKMIAEKGLMDLLKQGAVTQFKASLEEGLEEIFQQAIHNEAIRQYDPNHKITEGMLESFEGGFYNWMNLLAGGGDVLNNFDINKDSIRESLGNSAYNAGVNTRKVVDNAANIYNNVKNKVTGGKDNVTNNQANTENNQTNIGENQTNITDNQGQTTAIQPQNTSITPVNNNIQQQDSGAIELQDEEQTENKVENKNTAIKEGGLTNKVLEQLNGLDENTRERIKKNPYSVQEAKDLIDEMENNPGIDFRDYQNSRYEDILNEVIERLEKEDNKRRNDIGGLYDKLEQANTPVDVTELKNKVAEFEAQAEALEDIATTAELAQIKTILKNIQEIGDGTMDVWKVRKIADKRSKRTKSSSYDGIGLIWDIRNAIDDVIVKQNPDMKEVDKAYRDVLRKITEIKGKLYYKDGGLKSNAVSTIKNMMNASNRIDLNNLEKYIPGIKDQLQAIDDSKFVYNAYTTGKGSRFISGIARGVFGNLGKAFGLVGFGWAGLLGGAVVDAAIDKAIINMTRNALKKTITQETEASKAELERINKKIQEGKDLDAKDKARLKELGEKIVKNGEQMAKTKAEKEAWNRFIEEMDENITPQTTAEEQEKNKVTKKKATKKNKVTSKSVDKGDTNVYNSEDKGSPLQPLVSSQQGDESTRKTSFFATRKNEKGKDVLERIKGGEKQVIESKAKNKDMFTNKEEFDYNSGWDGYFNELNNVIYGDKDVGTIGSVDIRGELKPVVIDDNSFTHIFEKHGEFNKKNLIATVNNPDYKIIDVKTLDKQGAKPGQPAEFKPVKDKINLVKELPSKNGFLVVGANYNAKKGYYVATHFEIVYEKGNELSEHLSKGTPLDEKTAKYVEEHPYTEQPKNVITSKNTAVTKTVKEETKSEVKKEQPKNKVTAKKAEATAPKQEENQTKKAEPKTAPITKDSEGNTLSKEDQEKFGDSKIVDEDGNLLVVMHGSSSQEIHDYYDETKAGSNVHADFKGVYFTDNLDLAEQFAHEQLPGSSAFRTVLGKRGHLYKSYVNITNPLNLNTATPEQLLPFFKEDVLTKTWDEEKRLDNLKGHPQFVKFHVDMDKVEKAGYDGIIAAIGKEGEGNEYIVFKGNQAKNIGEIEAPKTEAKKEQPKNKVTAKNNDILLEETPQVAEEDTGERDRMNELEQNETPQTSEEEQVKNKVTRKRTKAPTLKQEENQTLTKVDDKSEPTQRQRKLIYERLNKQDLNRENPLVPMLMNDIVTQGKGVWGYVYGAISQILGNSGIDFNKATDFFKSIGIDPEGWEKEMEIAPTYYYNGTIVNEKKPQQSESKNIVTKNSKVTEKKVEVREAPKTEAKPETKSDSEHFSYDEYGEVMNKIGEVEKEINERLDKQMEQERAEKMKRFNELDNNENTDRSDGSEIAKLAGELNNLTNKYDRLKEDELKKQVPELLKRKTELRDAFGRDWKAVLDNKFAEIEKPFNELRDRYRLKLKEELGLGDDVVYDEKFYDSLTPEQKKIADRLNKEYADKYEELRLKTAGGEVETKEESKSKITNTKNKVTTEKVEVAQPKTETKTEDNSDLIEKIGDRFYNYLKEQADRVNRGRKTLAPVTIEELLTSGPYHDSTKYIDIYERDVRNKLDNIMYQIGKLDLPEVKLTKEQQDQLYEASALNGDRDMIRIKLMKEWIDKNPSKAGEKLTELTNEGADMVEQLEKAKAYVAEIEKTQENKGNKTKATTNAKNKVTNPTKSKETSLFNENEVDKGNKSEGLNPDALPLQDYKEMQRLENGRYYSLGNALRHEKLGEYMGTKIATELVGDYNEIIEDERDPDNLEDRWVRIESDIEDMYDAYEDYLNKKNEGDRDEREVKLLLETADDLANKVIKGKTAKELIDQYNPDYQTDLKIYKRLLEKYPNFYNGKINLNGEYGKALREFAGLDNETAQDIDYQELAERENETAQIPTIFEEDLEQMNLRELEENETPQAEEEEMNKVTKRQPENPKNLVTSKTAENTNTEFETLPADVSIEREAKEMGPKRIAPDRLPRQQLTFEEGVKKLQEQVETVADYIKARKDYNDEMYGNYKGEKSYEEIADEYKRLKAEINKILWEDWQFKSNKSKEFTDLWKNISDNRDNLTALKEVAKNFYISKVKKDISKGYVYPQEVLGKIPGAKKAINNRERYQKGLDTSFSAKDERIDYSEKDKIGAGLKSQDGKQITKEQKEDIVKGILDFGRTMGLDMKKFAEDRGLVYVHLHGGSPFLSKFGGMYREATNKQGEKNISVSVGGAENVRHKNKRTGERETDTLNTTVSHELGHAMDYLVDNRLFTSEQKAILRGKYNPVIRLRDYYARGNEVVARAIEQYVAVENGQTDYYLENGNLDAGEFKGTDLEYYLKEVGSYYERPGYWSKPDYEKYVKPYVEEAFKNNFEEYKITPEQKDTKANSKNTVTASDLNKVTNR